MPGIEQLLRRHTAGERVIEGDTAGFQPRHQTIEQHEITLFRRQLAQPIVAEKTHVQDHAVAAQAK